MSEKLRTLAEQYLYRYKHTPETANWDTVVELGKELADTVILEITTTKTDTDNIISAAFKNNSIELPNAAPNATENALAISGKFSNAVLAYQARTGKTFSESRLAIRSIYKSTPLIVQTNEINLFLNGLKLDAIKAVSERTGCTFSTAKDVLQKYSTDASQKYST